MTDRIVPFDRYPNLPPLYRAFLRGLPAFYPDAPSLDAVAARAKSLLGRKARAGIGAFRYRAPEGRRMAEDLAAGRAVAVAAGHQVGLFTGPLFALLKAFDAIRVAREISARGVPAVPVFYALTDDHDLEEIAKTARPTAVGPEILVLEGADRANRRPVGPLPIPPNVSEIVDAFRADARAPEAGEILEAFAKRSAGGTSYADAFIETLFDLVEPDPLLVLDPLASDAGPAQSAFFLEAVRKETALREAWRGAAERLAAAGFEPPVAFKSDVFPFFVIEEGERRRAGVPAESAQKVESGAAQPSADVLTRPALKSWLLPMAASILGPSEIAYHAESLALYPLFGLPAPVLLPRTHAVLIGPGERRAAEALGIAPEDVFGGLPEAAAEPVPPEVERLGAIGRQTEEALTALDTGLKDLDASLTGALETTRRKVAYQIEQLVERVRKAADRRQDSTTGRHRRLETMLTPQGGGADRLYPPLVPLLAHGRPVLPAIRSAAGSALTGAVIVELGADAPARAVHAR
jgi:bacillithiol biosynthesis cysteine-adding enzyme BshC